MKSFIASIYAAISLALLPGLILGPVVLAGCATTTTQAGFNGATVEALALVDQVTLAATAAIKADVLKGQDADNTIAAIKTAKDGITLARQLVAAATLTPAQGNAKLAIQTATLTLTQTYLRTLEAKKP